MDAPPNIVFILADQLGARWLPTYGHPLVETPHLENFAAESAVFERAITTAPVCTPYRGCLLSGQYPSQTGVLENGQAFPDGITSLADHLNAGGYETYYVGKWHLSGAPQENRWVPPEKRAGFQHFIGWESHHVDHWAGLIWADDPENAVKMPGHETDGLTDVALDQMEQASAGGGPFFMLLSYQAPHPPCSPPAEFLAPYENRELVTEANADRDAWFKHAGWRTDYDAQRFRELYFGEISHLDAAFGRLLAAMDRLGLRDNTLVVFTSDHGEMAGAQGRFGKGVMYEEALRIPLIARAPGQAGSLRVDAPVSTVDLMPTLLDYAGCRAAGPGEGASLCPLIEGRAGGPDRVVISEYHDFCACAQDWKLITRGRRLEPAALYQLSVDPYELDNRLDDPACAAVRERLIAALSSWRARVERGERTQSTNTLTPTHKESESKWQTINT